MELAAGLTVPALGKAIALTLAPTVRAAPKIAEDNNRFILFLRLSKGAHTEEARAPKRYVTLSGHS